MMYVELLGGLIILMVAAEVMIRGAVGLARLFGLSPLLIGMTVVALGTSAPELVVSLDAALTGNAGIATGNIVGSNIANVLLIVGAAAVISPMARRGDRLYRDGALLVLCTALFIMLCWGETLDVAHGVLLLIIFLGFMGSAYWRDINNPKASAERVGEVEEIGAVPRKSWIAWAATLGGLAGIAVGADLMVGGGDWPYPVASNDVRHRRSRPGAAMPKWPSATSSDPTCSTCWASRASSPWPPPCRCRRRCLPLICGSCWGRRS